MPAARLWRVRLRERVRLRDLPCKEDKHPAEIALSGVLLFKMVGDPNSRVEDPEIN